MSAKIDVELIRRWQDERGRKIASEVFKRIRSGKHLRGLGLGEVDGRVDLRGVEAPARRVRRSYESQGFHIEEYAGLTEFKKVRLENLDFSGGRLQSLRFFDVVLGNCRFDGAYCEDWRAWAIKVANTSFDRADLRNSLLGSHHQGNFSSYTCVSFVWADLRGIACSAGPSFFDCDFSNARLDNVEFHCPRIVRCRFKGLLREVTFYGHCWHMGEIISQNPDALEDIDFSEAQLRWVDFRALNLGSVKFPSDEDHLLIHHYPCVLKRALEELADDPKLNSLMPVYEQRLKWLGPKQKVRVFHRLDFFDFGTREDGELEIDLLRRLERECGASADDRT